MVMAPSRGVIVVVAAMTEIETVAATQIDDVVARKREAVAVAVAIAVAALATAAAVATIEAVGMRGAEAEESVRLHPGPPKRV
mmetsp:Transcript_70177/g.109776  ORF Transcript_70177/g.109776 Transcript_70177/m.109776 type:complete len:83 (+) Transcript_70177:42-290(+)